MTIHMPLDHIAWLLVLTHPHSCETFTITLSCETPKPMPIPYLFNLCIYFLLPFFIVPVIRVQGSLDCGT